MLNQCLPVALHARCHLIFLMGKELDAIKSICQRTYTFKTDSVLNDKSMLTDFVASVFCGDDGWCLGGKDPVGSFTVLVLPIVGCKLAEVDDDCINWQWLARR